jgi:hypothetical protein
MWCLDPGSRLECVDMSRCLTCHLSILTPISADCTKFSLNCNTRLLRSVLSLIICLINKFILSFNVSRQRISLKNLELEVSACMVP